MRPQYALSDLLTIATLARSSFYYHRASLSSKDKYADLKQRIRGKYGHLSNEDCARGAAALAQAGAKRLVLAHLSDKNNNPLTALRCTPRVLDGTDCELYVAPRGAMEQPLMLAAGKEAQCSLFD